MINEKSCLRDFVFNHRKLLTVCRSRNSSSSLSWISSKPIYPVILHIKVIFLANFQSEVVCKNIKRKELIHHNESEHSSKSLCLSCTVKQTEEYSFSFTVQIWKFKMAVILERKLGRVSCWDTLGVENFDKIAVSRTVKEVWTILCFSRKTQNCPYLLNSARYSDFVKIFHPQGISARYSAQFSL